MHAVKSTQQLRSAIGRRYDPSGSLSGILSHKNPLSNMSTTKETSESVKVIQDEEKKQFRTPDGAAYLSYEIKPSTNIERRPNVIDLQHTFVPASFRGQGVAGLLCVAAFEHAKEKCFRVQPTCTYISGTFLLRNPEWKEFLVEDAKKSGL